MNARTASIRGLDTLLFRDGRPFDTTPGSVAAGLKIPFPSTLAGFLRTRAGEAAGSFEKARALQVRGPLLCRNDEVLFASPADGVVFDSPDGLECLPLRPFSPKDGAGCDNPGHMEPVRMNRDAKPAGGFELWPAAAMMRWLADERISATDLLRDAGPTMDERTHVQIGRETGAAEEGMLFSTSMVAFEKLDGEEHVIYSYLVQLREPSDAQVPKGAGLLGGEQRIGLIEEARAAWPTCPQPLAQKLSQAKHVRLVLATPAVFERGWEPGWLDRTTKEGQLPGSADLSLRLIAATVPRRQAVSGWEYGGSDKGKPKPVRWLAPAGSVYFFEVVSGDPSFLADAAWLGPVSDLEAKNNGATISNNRDDGFGLALWGIWTPEEATQ